MDDKHTEAGSFLGGWVSTSVSADGYKAPGDLDRARHLATRCLAVAAGQDLSRQDLEAVVGDLDEHMRKAENIAQKLADAMVAPHGLHTP